jgi:hypothetical protein
LQIKNYTLEIENLTLRKEVVILKTDAKIFDLKKQIEDTIKEVIVNLNIEEEKYDIDLEKGMILIPKTKGR